NSGVKLIFGAGTKLIVDSGK
uniref:Uncharacterized protein n=1 Tax=Myripristis murdjan TaxID=586833 RepID=A0A668A653_9TELE